MRSVVLSSKSIRSDVIAVEEDEMGMRHKNSSSSFSAFFLHIPILFHSRKTIPRGRYGSAEPFLLNA
jgi:hypothetical protein